MLVDYHGNGDPNDELVLFEFDEMKTAIQREQAAKAEKWSTILKSRANRHRMGLAMLMTFMTNVSGCPYLACGTLLIVVPVIWM